MGLTVLDAGILIAALDAADVHHSPSVEAMRVRTASSVEFALPASAYAELMVGPTAKGGGVAARVDRLLDGVPVAIVSADRRIARRAAGIRAAHPRLKLPDALVIATGLELQADEVLTTDTGWPNVEIAVTVVRPTSASGSE